MEKTCFSRHFNGIAGIEELTNLSPERRRELGRVAERYPFRMNDHYLSLIDWGDAEDPIGRIVIPHERELEEWGKLDPSDEESYTKLAGLEHKYSSTALLLVSNECECICRYCFRKRVFTQAKRETLEDVGAAIEYIKRHEEITNVLLTGGDPFILKTARLEEIIRQLREIGHVQIIRIGTKMPAFNPQRIIEDASFLEMLDKYSSEKKKIYIMTHFVHGRELTDAAIESVNLMQRAGAIIGNQMPLIKGVNDNPETLAELLSKLSFIGAVPYYIFQCRPSSGNKAYTVPIERGYEIVEEAKSVISRLAKRARFVMSHASGKIEIAEISGGRVYFKYLRAANDKDSGRLFICKSNQHACWLDDYDEVTG
jgi:KamA family protein